MSADEVYLNHPTFGLLFRVCEIENNNELFATLYAQRLFFLVTIGERGTSFEPITRADARVLVENRLRFLKRKGSTLAFDKLQISHKQTFL